LNLAGSKMQLIEHSRITEQNTCSEAAGIDIPDRVLSGLHVYSSTGLNASDAQADYMGSDQYVYGSEIKPSTTEGSFCVYVVKYNYK